MTDPTMGNPAQDAEQACKMEGMKPYQRVLKALDILEGIRTAQSLNRIAERALIAAIRDGDEERVQSSMINVAASRYVYLSLKDQLRQMGADLIKESASYGVGVFAFNRGPNATVRRRVAASAAAIANFFTNRPRRPNRPKHISFGSDTYVRLPVTDQPPAEREE